MANRWIEPAGRWRGSEHGVVAFESQCDTGKDFFIWIRRNPLIRLDSAKGIQGNASFFAWIYLLLLAFIDV
jgi:hypothetical protein